MIKQLAHLCLKTSQLDGSCYATSHDRMNIFRGIEWGHERVEAFVSHAEGQGALPV
jgi:hypothetical protein